MDMEPNARGLSLIAILTIVKDCERLIQLKDMLIYH